MTMITTSLTIATDSVAVRHGNGDAASLLARCDAWLALREAAEWEIRDSRFNVSRKLDSLDKAHDRVRSVRLNCIEKLAARKAA